MSKESEHQELVAAGIEFIDPETTKPGGFSEEALNAAFTGRTRLVEPEEQELVSAEELRNRAAAEEERLAELAKKAEERRGNDRIIRSERWEQIIPAAFRGATVESLDSTVSSACMKWLALSDSNKWCLLLFGPTGTGKTHAMYALARELFIDRYDVLVIDIREFMDEMRSDYENSSKMMDRLLNAEVLCIDELGGEKASEWSSEKIDMLINHRWQHAKPTIVTTNLNPKILSERLGSRSSSRLISGTIVRLEGRDRRISS